MDSSVDRPSILTDYSGDGVTVGDKAWLDKVEY